MSDIGLYYSAVYAIVIKDDQILLLQRQNTGFKDGQYGVPAGHRKANETPTAAVIREATEEAGITVLPDDCQLVHTMYRKQNEREYVDFFFIIKNWSGNPTNQEPHICADINWWPLDGLPDAMMDYQLAGITAWQQGKVYNEMTS